MAKKKMGGLGKGLDRLFADLPDDLIGRSGRLHPAEARDRTRPRAAPQTVRRRCPEAAGRQHYGKRPAAAHCRTPQKAGPRVRSSLRASAAGAPPGLAGLDEVPVIIKDVTDEQAAALALIENLQREDLNPIEVAEGCHQLIDKYGLTQETAANW